MPIPSEKERDKKWIDNLSCKQYKKLKEQKNIYEILFKRIMKTNLTNLNVVISLSLFRSRLSLII